MKTAKPIQAWHFISKTLRDGRPIPKDGEWLKCNESLVMCKTGLHASRHPFDALQYAPGDTLCLVDCAGERIEQKDKLVCAKRRIVARMDVTELCRYFARMQALSVVHLWNAPDVVLDYLMTGAASSTTSSAAYAASSAAWSAARSTARSTASNAAYAASSAAQSAASSAARSTASSAAYAASSAAWSAASSAASSAARAEFNALVRECFEGVLR